MPRKSREKYRPDYSALYPGVEISSKLLDALKESDCKIEYTEYDLKRERFVVDKETGIAAFLPSREDSLERLLEQDKQFRDESATPEEIVTEALYIKQLHHCLTLLDEDERDLIDALFFKGMTEREYTNHISLSKTAIHARKVKILDKLKNILENQLPS